MIIDQIITEHAAQTIARPTPRRDGCVNPTTLLRSPTARLDPGQRVLVIADGAVWIWNLVEDRFKEAVQRLGLYHANTYLWAVANELQMKRCGQFWSTQGDEALLCLEMFWRNQRWELLFPHAKLTAIANN
jgi:hypothetical protein